MADVFIDLWGVLTDSRKGPDAYRQRLGELLRARLGGDLETWTAAHDAAQAAYGKEAESAATWTHGSWVEIVDRLDATYLRYLFERARVPPPATDILEYARALEAEVLAGMNVRFPDARTALERLKTAGHRLFLATAATERSARATLAGAELASFFDTIFTGTSQNARKLELRYWERISNRVDIEVFRAFVVDDRLAYLRAAASVGFRCLLMDRDGRHAPEAMPPFVEATLKTLVGLPQYLATAAPVRA